MIFKQNLIDFIYRVFDASDEVERVQELDKAVGELIEMKNL